MNRLAPFWPPDQKATKAARVSNANFAQKFIFLPRKKAPRNQVKCGQKGIQIEKIERKKANEPEEAAEGGKQRPYTASYFLGKNPYK
jgi:hypothetical protein